VGKLLLSAELYPVVQSQAATLNPIDGNATISGWPASGVDRNILPGETSKSNSRKRKNSMKTKYICVISPNHHDLTTISKRRRSRRKKKELACDCD